VSAIDFRAKAARPPRMERVGGGGEQKGWSINPEVTTINWFVNGSSQIFFKLTSTFATQLGDRLRIKVNKRDTSHYSGPQSPAV
jgi:hypothetical protein